MQKHLHITVRVTWIGEGKGERVCGPEECQRKRNFACFSVKFLFLWYSSGMCKTLIPQIFTSTVEMTCRHAVWLEGRHDFCAGVSRVCSGHWGPLLWCYGSPCYWALPPRYGLCWSAHCMLPWPWLCPALPCPALPCLALPCPALPLECARSTCPNSSTVQAMLADQAVMHAFVIRSMCHQHKAYISSAGLNYTGTAINPARALGPAIVFHCHWDKVWLYVIAGMHMHLFLYTCIR